MNAIRHTATVPANRELRIKIPEHIAENERVEIILLIGREAMTFQEKVALMKEAMNDPMFLEDLHEVSEDFTHPDSEDWKDDG